MDGTSEFVKALCFCSSVNRALPRRKTPSNPLRTEEDKKRVYPSPMEVKKPDQVRNPVPSVPLFSHATLSGLTLAKCLLGVQVML